MKRYRIWLYGRYYYGQSKTKAIASLLRDWSYIPSAASMTKHDRKGNVVEYLSSYKWEA